MKNLKPNMIVENRMPNSNTVIVCRVIGKIFSAHDSNALIGWRLVDINDDNGASDKQLIARNKTWCCPEENIFYHDKDCRVCHKDGLISLG